MDMNEELQKLTVGALQELGQWIQSLKDFTVEQTPLFVREYAQWYVWSNAISFMTFAIAVGVCVWVVTKYTKSALAPLEAKGSKRTFDEDGMHTMYWVVRFFATVIGVVCFFVASDSLKEVGKGVFAPRLVIVEGILSLAKTATVPPAAK